MLWAQNELGTLRQIFKIEVISFSVRKETLTILQGMILMFYA